MDPDTKATQPHSAPEAPTATPRSFISAVNAEFRALRRLMFQLQIRRSAFTGIHRNATPPAPIKAPTGRHRPA